jgi:anti-sigma factor RsiW
VERCPTADQLHRLLSGQLDDVALASIEPHVESCSACQAALAEIADDDETR